jgi:hypothetical protein
LAVEYIGKLRYIDFVLELVAMARALGDPTRVRTMEFKIEDTIVDTGKAAQKWDSRNTSSQGQDEKLYRSDQCRYYIVRTSQGQGSLPSAEFVSKDAATR